MVSFVSINFMMLYTTQTIIKNKNAFLFIESAKKVGFRSMKLMLKMIEDEMSMY